MRLVGAEYHLFKLVLFNHFLFDCIHSIDRAFLILRSRWRCSFIVLKLLHERIYRYMRTSYRFMSPHSPIPSGMHPNTPLPEGFSLFFASIHLNEALVAPLDGSSLSGNLRSWKTSKSSDGRSWEVCGVTEAPPRSSSSIRPLPKHHVELLYARSCLSELGVPLLIRLLLQMAVVLILGGCSSF